MDTMSEYNCFAESETFSNTTLQIKQQPSNVYLKHFYPGIFQKDMEKQEQDYRTYIAKYYNMKTEISKISLWFLFRLMQYS